MTAAALCFAPMALAATQTYVADTVSSSPSSATCGLPTISVAETGDGFTWVDTLPPKATVTAVRLELDLNCLDDAGLGTLLNGVPGGSVPRLDAGACDCGSEGVQVIEGLASSYLPGTTNLWILPHLGRLWINPLTGTPSGYARVTVEYTTDGPLASEASVASLTTDLATAQTGINTLSTNTTGLATAAGLTTAQTGITAMEGSGFTAGTDDLHSTRAALAALSANTTGLATAAGLATAQTGITAMEGSGFTAGTDDLHSTRAALAALSTNTTGLATAAGLTSAQTAITTAVTSATAPLATAAGLATAQTAINALGTNTTGLATAAGLTSAQTAITTAVTSTTAPLATSAALAAATAAITDIEGLEHTNHLLAIQDDLSNRLSQPSLLYLPGRFGGELEVVRGVVADAIAQNVAAGLSVGKAPKYLASGDTAAAGGDYRGAWGSYQSAYQAAVGL